MVEFRSWLRLIGGGTLAGVTFLTIGWTWAPVVAVGGAVLLEILGQTVDYLTETREVDGDDHPQTSELSDNSIA